MRTFFKHAVVRNALALYLAQAAGLILPLVTLPYLARTLGPSGWGFVLFAQSFAVWVSLFVEYGFTLSASRQIARHQGDPARVAGIVADVLGAKAVLLVPTLVGVGIAAWFSPLFKERPEFLGWALLHALAMGFSPFWYFQGTERMARAVSVELLARFVATGGIFLWVKSPSDGWRAVALQAIGGVFTTSLTTWWVFREVGWQRPRWACAVKTLKESFGVFVFKASSSLYAGANAFILGLIASSAVVGYYGGAERLATALLTVTGPVSQALYPRMSHLVGRDLAQAARLARLSMGVVGGLSAVVGLGAVITAPWLVPLVLGPGFEQAIPALRILGLLLPLRAVSNVLGMQWLLPLGMEAAVSRVVLLAGALNVVLAVLLATRWMHVGMATAVVLSEAVVVSGLSWTILRHQRAASRVPSVAAPLGAGEG